MSATETTSEHSTASVSDVRGVINTEAEDGQIVSKLEDAWYDNQRVNDVEAMDEIDVQMLEKYLAALDIRTTIDRSLSSGKRKSVSLTYEDSQVERLRAKVRDLDPSGELCPPSGVVRRTSDHVGSARPHSRDGIGDRGPRRERR